MAQPHAPEVLGDARYWQLVVFLLEHGPRGSRGVILNRPAAAKFGDLLQWGYTSTQADESESARIERAFSGCQVYLGGFFSPNRIGQQPITLLHGQAQLADSHEVLPGIYIGGVLYLMQPMSTS